MTYDEIYKEFLDNLHIISKNKIVDYRPSGQGYEDRDDIAGGIIVWFKDGSRIIYLPKNKKEV